MAYAKLAAESGVHEDASDPRAETLEDYLRERPASLLTFLEMAEQYSHAMEAPE